MWMKNSEIQFSCLLFIDSLHINFLLVSLLFVHVQ